MTREESREAAIAAALRALPSRSSSRAQWRRRSRRTWLAPALATAAVLVAITVAVSLVNAGRHTSNRASTAAGAAPQVTVGSIVQMGAIDEAGLKAAVTAASERSPADRSASGSAGPSSALGSYGAVSPKAAPITTDDATVIERCDSQLRRSGSPGDRRTFVGVGSWSGTPAVVIAFTSGSDHTNVYVMSRAACEILHFQRFSA